MRVLHVIAGGFAIVVTLATAHAEGVVGEAARRRVVAPLIRKLTDCVAHGAVDDPSVLNAYRYGGLSGALSRHLGDCRDAVSVLLETYESVYGEGTAEEFIKGPYLADLPRAVLARIKPRLDAEVSQTKVTEAAAEAEQQRHLAEEQRKQEEERRAAVQAENERQATEQRAALDKQNRIDVAKRAMGILRDKFYDCADKQLVGLVKSGESADVLASAAMTMCGQSLSDLQDSAIEENKAENNQSSNSSFDDVLRLKVKDLVHERVAADAVQAKAGMGIFAGNPAAEGRF